MVIIGIDPGIATVGFGIIEVNKNKTSVIDYGVISTPKTDALPVRLQKIYKAITHLIEIYKPSVMAVEELFFTKNVKTGISVAEGRGVCLLAGVHANLELFEYTPNQVKQALTGLGKAEKKQVQYMVKAVLNLQSIPKPDDAADALAVALCHSQTNQSLYNTRIR